MAKGEVLKNQPLLRCESRDYGEKHDFEHQLMPCLPHGNRNGGRADGIFGRHKGPEYHKWNKKLELEINKLVLSDRTVDHN